MKTTKYLMLAVATLGLGVASIGCSSSSSCADGGVCAAGGAGGAGAIGGLGGAGGSGPTLFALTPGTYCFTVLSTVPGADGCGVGPTLVTNHSLPVTYDMTSKTIEVGTDGSIGIGIIANNQATLLRDSTTADDTVAACTWHQADTTALQMTAENTFTVSVVEDQDTFSAACATASPVITPVGGTCTSTWSWSMMITGAANPPACN